MANETVEKTGTLMQSVIRMLDSTVSNGASYENIINVLSLICLVSILSSNHSTSNTTAIGTPNPLQKIIGDLTKSDGGVGPDTLMSLLPLLNSPQLKSKLNPATISSVLGLISNLSDKGDSVKNDKQEKPPKATQESTPEEKPQPSPSSPPSPPAAALTSSEEIEKNESEYPDRRGIGRYLNWKSNF
ncbi:MAG: hypothetical protein H6Q73_3059 [Firmicutes bacterium]|nr:hypothetical protein [Bacillota bacterium]